MPRVFIPQWPMMKNRDGERLRVNLDPAREFGELTVLVEDSLLGVVDPRSILPELLEKLRDFCDDDVMLCVGNPTLMVVAAMVAAEANGSRIRFIQWRPNERRYVEWAVTDEFWTDLYDGL